MTSALTSLASSSGSGTPCALEVLDPPTYTYFTSCSEEVIDSNLPLRTVTWLGSCYVKKWKKLNVFLKDQPPNLDKVALPHYDRNEHIHGTIQLPLEIDACAVEATVSLKEG
jgi:hypothetical protein